MDLMAETKQMKYKGPILGVLFGSIAALGIWLGVRLYHLFKYEYTIDYVSTPAGNIMVNDFPFSMLWAILLQFVLCLAPVVVFFLYVLMHRENEKAAICLPLTLGLIALHYWCSSGIFGNFFSVGIYFDFVYYGLDQLFTILIALVFTLAAIGVGIQKKIKKPSAEVIILISAGCGLLSDLVLLAQQLRRLNFYGRFYTRLNEYSGVLLGLCSLCLGIALLLYALGGLKLPKRSLEAEMKRIQNMPPEWALRALQAKFYQGQISEEEYAARRAEILRRL